jgi:hypothetical protein
MLCTAIQMIIELTREFEQYPALGRRETRTWEADAKRVGHVQSRFSNINRLGLAPLAGVWSTDYKIEGDMVQAC